MEQTNIFLAILALIGGFVLLIKGADWFVEGSSSVAKLFKVPAIIIGLTVVAFGTSLPEASVSISSALAGKNALAVSNVVGSNIFNILVVLGASAIIAPVCVLPDSVKKEIPFSILCTIALLCTLLLGMDVGVLSGRGGGAAIASITYTIGAAGGIVLLAIFAFYMYWQISTALKVRKASGSEAEEGDFKVLSPARSIVSIVFGVACIIVGGNFVVDGASAIAIKFGMSETLVGMTIVALGTSLPELVTSMMAAKKGESDLALGNAVGSNIFNIVFILGFSALISPITVDALAVIDTIAVISASVLVLLFSATDKKISRIEGGSMVAVYFGYFVYMFLR